MSADLTQAAETKYIGSMPKTTKRESLYVEIDDLVSYDDDDLACLRERLIQNEQRIHQESVDLAQRIKELNVARNALQQELAENAKSMRAVKHVLGQRNREPQRVAVPAPATKAKRAGSAPSRRAGYER